MSAGDADGHAAMSVRFRGAPCLNGQVVEKVLSAKSGLNEAFTSLLRGFEVCGVMLPIE